MGWSPVTEKSRHFCPPNACSTIISHLSIYFANPQYTFTMWKAIFNAFLNYPIILRQTSFRRGVGLPSLLNVFLHNLLPTRHYCLTAVFLAQHKSPTFVFLAQRKFLTIVFLAQREFLTTLVLFLSFQFDCFQLPLIH